MENLKITGIYALTAVVIALCLAVLLYFVNDGELPGSGQISLCVVVSLIVTFGFGAFVRRRQAKKGTVGAGGKNIVGLVLLCSAIALGACARKSEPSPPPPPPPPPQQPTPTPTPPPPPPPQATPTPPAAAAGGGGGGGGAAVATGRASLIKGEAEDSEFGLFSYLLFPSPPAGATQTERYKAALAAFLRTPTTLGLQESGIEKEDLNVFYVPLTKRTSANVDSLLKYYDYERATAILALIPGTQQQGPYLVSAVSPIKSTAPTKYMLQDMTVVFPTMVDAWITQFRSAALQPRFWHAANRDQWLLSFRNVVAVAAAVIPNVQDSVKSWIKWIEG